MGYRSDVRIITTKEGFQKLKEFSHNFLQELGEDKLQLDLMETLEVSKITGNQVYFGWDYLKWYYDYDDVKAIEKGLDYLEENDYSYRFARMGESYDDYDERAFDSDNKIEEQGLDYPSITRCFDDEVF